MALADIPLISGGHGFRGHSLDLQRDRFGFLARVSREVKDVARLRVLTRDIIMVNSPATIREVLVEKAKHFEKSPMIRLVLYPLAGEGLFTSGGALWRRQRRLMAPVFHPGKINTLAPLMVDCARRACEQWRDGAEFDVARETTRIAMAIAGRTLFGIDTFDEADSLGHALTVALEWADRATVSLPIGLQVELRLLLLSLSDSPAPVRKLIDRIAMRLEQPLLLLTRRDHEMQRAIAVLDERVQRMIDERRASTEPSTDLLSHLLHARDEDDGHAMSDKQVRDEIITLFVAGHETTANGLAWSIYLLARHPEAYAQARAVVDALGGKPPTLADVDKLGFLARVFKEALRLYPPVYLFGRVSVADTSIGGYDVPAHSIVLISPWTVQHRADIWPDPERFDPDRFTPEADAARPRDAWIPFSDGPRVCIGQHFAQLEAPLVLATLLQHADLELTDPREVLPDASPTLRPAGGIHVRVKHRAMSRVQAAIPLHS